MQSSRVEARHLKFGDVIAIDGVDGSWTVQAIFIEGKDGPVDIDLLNLHPPPGLACQYEWFVGQDHLVQLLPQS